MNVHCQNSDSLFVLINLMLTLIYIYWGTSTTNVFEYFIRRLYNKTKILFMSVAFREKEREGGIERKVRGGERERKKSDE